MEQYELAVLYHPDLEIDLEKAEAQVLKHVADAGGSVKSTDNWGKRKLAYKIAGHDYAVYVFYTVNVEGTAVQKIEYSLNITDEVIRFLVVKPDEKAIAKAAAHKAKRKAPETDKEEKTEEK